jgi:hypothetical protein|nr:MAG TPA: hypothetical protein [Caudoviricetes sp.]
MTDEQIRDLIAKPYKQPAAAMMLAAKIAATETIDTLYRKVGTDTWNKIMAALETIAHTRLAEEIDEYNWEQRQTE